jgi:hypothetical protein
MEGRKRRCRQLQRTGMKVLNGRKEEETQAATEDRYESLKWKEG